MKEVQNIRLDVGVDPDMLDREWVNHPRTYFRYAHKLAVARGEYERAKAKLDLTVANLDASIRSTPIAFGLDATKKPTESAIELCIHRQGDYLTTQQEMLEAKHKMDVYSAAVNALEHKKKALEKMVDLFLANYYGSKPKTPDGQKEGMQEMEKRLLRRRGIKGSE